MAFIRFIFWFFLVLMIPFTTLLAVSSYSSAAYGMLSLNVLTIVISAFNVYNAHITISRMKEFKLKNLAGKIDNFIKGVK